MTTQPWLFPFQERAAVREMLPYLFFFHLKIQLMQLMQLPFLAAKHLPLLVFT